MVKYNTRADWIIQYRFIVLLSILRYTVVYMKFKVICMHQYAYS